MDDASELRAILTRGVEALEAIRDVLVAATTPEPTVEEPPQTSPEGCQHPPEMRVDLTGIGTFDEFECKACRRQFRLMEQGV